MVKVPNKITFRGSAGEDIDISLWGHYLTHYSSSELLHLYSYFNASSNRDTSLFLFQLEHLFSSETISPKGEEEEIILFIDKVYTYIQYINEYAVFSSIKISLWGKIRGQQSN